MKAQRLQRDFFGSCIVHVGVSPYRQGAYGLAIPLARWRTGDTGVQTKNREGDRPPLGAPSICAAARIFGGLHKRRMATRGRLGRPDFSIAGGVRGTPSAPHESRRLRRAKFRPVQRASAIVTGQRRRRRGGFVSARGARVERDPKETR
jgi:hypothetical protein